jgi:hypothetical protein
VTPALAPVSASQPPVTKTGTTPPFPDSELARLRNENRELRRDLAACQDELADVRRALSGFRHVCGHDVGWHEEAGAIAAWLDQQGYRWDRDAGRIVPVKAAETPPQT